MDTSFKILKTLSANDTGDTGAHQAGILIPKKEPNIFRYFPSLDQKFKNPRVSLSFYDVVDGTKWDFEFIYYNNKLFGGTRNEYRLTWMTKYFQAKNAKVGDQLEFSINSDGKRFIDLVRSDSTELNNEVIKLSGTWRIINLKN